MPLRKSEPGRFGNWLFACGCWTTGTDPEILAECPKRDRDHVATIALIQLAVLVWQTLVFTLAAHLMLAKPGEFRPELVVVAVLLAVIIALIDSYMIIRSSWYLHGIEELQRAGLKLPGSLSVRLKNACFVILRFLLASVSAEVVAGILSILIFGKDIEGRIEAVYQLQNATLQQNVSAEYERGTRDKERSRQQIEAQLAEDTDRTKLVSATISNGHDADQIQALSSRIADLEKRRDAASADLRSAEAFASDELGGIRHDPRNSGIPGRGPRRLAAEERKKEAAERVRVAERELAVERKRLDEMRSAILQQGQLREASAGPRLADIELVRQAHLKELAALDAQLADRRTGRPAAIAFALEHDPSYHPRESGLLARARALAAIAAEDPWAKSLIIALGVFFLVVELAAVVAKTFTFVPSAYARTLAEQECSRACQVSQSLAETFNLAADRRLEPDRAPPVPESEKADRPAGSKVESSGEAKGDRGDNSPMSTFDKEPRRPRGRPPKQPPAFPSESEGRPEIRRQPPEEGNGLFGA